MPTWQGDGSIGGAKESTFGTAVTVTKFLEFLPSSKITWDPTFAQGQSMRVGSRVDRSARRPASPVRQIVNGNIDVEMMSKGMGWLLEAGLGTVVSTQRATTGVYQHNFTATMSDPLPSYTIQLGLPPVGGGTTLPHTFSGMTCNTLEFAVPNSEIATINSTWVGKDMATATSYAAPSYPTPIEILTFKGASITLGGSPTGPTTTLFATGGTAVTNVRDFTLNWTNNLDDGGFNMGGAGKRSRRPVLGKAPITGSFTAEFDAVTLRDAYIAQTDLALVVTLLGDTTIGTGSDKGSLSIYVPNIRLEGEIPAPTDGGVITQTINYTGFDNLSAAPITVSYASTDTAP